MISCISKMKRGAYLINTARGKICDREAIVKALESGQLAGYAGDVWFPQPAPQRSSMANDATPWHDTTYFGYFTFSTSTLCSRHTRNIECWFEDRPIRDEYLLSIKVTCRYRSAFICAGNVTGGLKIRRNLKKGKR